MSDTPPAIDPKTLGSKKWRIPRLVDRAVSLGVTESDSEETQRTKRLLAAALWISLVTSVTTISQFVWFGAPLAAVALSTATLVAFIALLLMWRWPATYPAVMHWIAGSSILVSVALTLLFGGFLESGANAVWGYVSVLGALVIFEDRRATFWLLFFAGTMIVAEALASSLDPLYSLPNPGWSAIFNLLVTIAFTFAVLFYYVRQRSTLLRQSDALLRNVLPDEIATRLKSSTEMIADDIDSASILFADVAGFTPMSADMTPTELVSLLNQVFTEFDGLVEERGLEKIKTIGDAYMVASGIPVPRRDHAHAICELALAMQNQVGSRTYVGHPIRFRIGINSGPVVAGIIGRHKFSYDLWGDAVNTASRMETTGVPGKIQITGQTLELIGDDFVTEPGGTVEVKGKGPMPVWYLISPRR